MAPANSFVPAAWPWSRRECPTAPGGPAVPAIGPRYTRIKHLDEGGNGVVWKAWDMYRRRWVVVKTLKKRLNRRRVQAFLKEIRGNRRANGHPNVVRYLDSGLDRDGQPFLVIEYVKGGSLRALLDRAGPLNPRLACAIVAGAARGVQRFHDTVGVHRDIKPANILLDGYTPKLTDLGTWKAATPARSGVLSRLAALLSGRASHPDADGAASAYCGTSRYGDPRRVADYQADVYSLGLVLFECLTGRLPTERSAFLARRHGEALDRDWGCGLPAAVRFALETCLAPPGDRYQSAGELAEVLAGLAADRYLEDCASGDRGATARPAEALPHRTSFKRLATAVRTFTLASCVACCLAIAGDFAQPTGLPEREHVADGASAERPVLTAVGAATIVPNSPVPGPPLAPTTDSATGLSQGSETPHPSPPASPPQEPAAETRTQLQPGSPAGPPDANVDAPLQSAANAEAKRGLVPPAAQPSDSENKVSQQLARPADAAKVPAAVGNRNAPPFVKGGERKKAGGAPEPDAAAYVTCAEIVLPRGAIFLIVPNQQINECVDVRIGGKVFRLVAGKGTFWVCTASRAGATLGLFLVYGVGSEQPNQLGFGVDRPGLVVDGNPTTWFRIHLHDGTVKRVEVRKG